MSIKDKLSLLIEELQRHNSPVIPLLQNGLTQDEIDNVIKPLGLNFPGELYELYSRKNGIAKNLKISADFHFPQREYSSISILQLRFIKKMKGK